MRHVTGGNTLAQDKEEADYLSTCGAMGNRWKHFGIGEDNQTLDIRGRARYLKREGQLVFQNKTGNDETRHESKPKT